MMQPTVTFTSSAATTNFTVGDVTVSGGDLVPLVEVVQPTQQRLLQQQMEQPRLTWPQGRLQMLPDIPMQQQHSLTGPTM